MPHYIVGLDIGSHAVKAGVLEIRRGGERVVREFLSVPSLGVRKGVVQDISDVAQALSPVIAGIKKYGKGSVAFVLGVGSSDVKLQTSVGVVAVSRADYEIYQDDINRAIQSAQAITLPANRVVLHALVREFIVDGVRDIKDPLEMVGNRLEVTSLIIDTFAPHVSDARKCVEMLGGKVRGVLLSPLASAEAVLSKNQRELGAVLIDIGAGKTGMAVYEEGKLLHAALFPVGSANITNDLAIGLKVSVDTAETIKRSYGSAFAREVAARESIDLAKVDERAKGTVTKKYISEIIEVRLAEIFDFVNNELKAIGKARRLPAGVVLTGGGVKIPGIVDLTKQELKLPVQIGVPEPGGAAFERNELEAVCDDPEFACAVGLMRSGYDTLGEEGVSLGMPGAGALRKIFRYFIP